MILTQNIQVQVLKNQALLAEKCHVADSFASRLLGLMFKKGLPRGEGVFFPDCKSVHMWFMRFPIDVVFLRKTKESQGEPTRWIVSSIFEKAKPWKMIPCTDLRASSVIELPEGTASACYLEVGDEVCLS